MSLWSKDKPEEPKPSKVKVVGGDSGKYVPKFDFDITSIPFLIRIEKGGVGSGTRLYFESSGGIPIVGILEEDLKPDGTWGYVAYEVVQIGRDDHNYNLIFEIGDNAIEYYFDLKKISTMFQKLGFRVGVAHCKQWDKLQKMVEQSNNLVYLNTVQQMRDRGETV